MPEIVELREWSRIASDLTCDRTWLVKRARQQLWRYYPQLLKVEGDLTKASGSATTFTGRSATRANSFGDGTDPSALRMTIGCSNSALLG